MIEARNSSQDDPSLLVKQSLAAKLREEIIRGQLAPGQRIIEGYWARKFGVAQTSVREAINLLISEGFATKASGRSARVTSYSEADIAQIYEIRGALEGLAAGLAAQRQPDLEPLEAALKEMRKAMKSGEIRKLIENAVHINVVPAQLQDF